MDRKPYYVIATKIGYESLSECGRKLHIHTSSLTNYCKNKNKFMYLDEYNNKGVTDA